jgi:hypothetical protein
MLCYIINKKSLGRDVKPDPRLEILHVPWQDNLFATLSYMSLDLERLLLERSLLYTDTPPPKIFVLWEDFRHDLYDIIEYTKDFRADELVTSYDKDRKIDWMAGNARAMTKWAGSLFKLRTKKPIRYDSFNNFISIENSNDKDMANEKLTWWAYRLDLKLYHYTK